MNILQKAIFIAAIAFVVITMMATKAPAHGNGKTCHSHGAYTTHCHSKP